MKISIHVDNSRTELSSLLSSLYIVIFMYVVTLSGLLSDPL